MAERLGASFRDPSGFVFLRNGEVFRHVSPSYLETFRSLESSGFLAGLVQAGLLIPFEERKPEELSPDVGTILQAEKIAYITYPYEWSFGQLKDAAIATLEVQRRALESGFSLKDATAYNIQYHHGNPTFIDLLSFEPYQEGEPWIAYRQFCRHFLAPLALMAYVDPRLNSLLRANIDGIPLDLATRILPGKTKFKLGLATHLFMHAAADQKQGVDAKARPMSKAAMLAMVDHLRSTIKGLTWEPKDTQWLDYYQETNYSNEAEEAKLQTVEVFLARLPKDIRVCWDLGANTGKYSELAVNRGLETIAFDIDPGAVERAYRSQPKFLPLLQDLTNPSPATGWNLAERSSFFERGPADVAMALALVHHLSLGQNAPLAMAAEVLARCGNWLIVEFVGPEDSQVKRMMHARRNQIHEYSKEVFEAAFSEHFEIIDEVPISDTVRTLYLCRRLQ